MVPRRLAAGLLALLLLTTAAAAAEDSGPVYVALGDSYSSGEGVPPFAAGTDTKENPCHRSTRAYPMVYDPGARSFACAGAATEDFFAGGRSVDTPDGQVAKVPAGTDLITLTVGGNDLGFGQVMTACTFRDCTTDDRYRDLPDRIESLRPDLRPVYRALAERAPEARILVLGYPRFLTNTGRVEGCGQDAGLSPAERDWLNGHLAHLNQVIQDESAVAGTEYLDVEEAFAGHEVCAPEPWSSGVDRQRPGWSYHPNVDGQRALAAAVERGLKI